MKKLLIALFSFSLLTSCKKDKTPTSEETYFISHTYTFSGSVGALEDQKNHYQMHSHFYSSLDTTSNILQLDLVSGLYKSPPYNYSGRSIYFNRNIYGFDTYNANKAAAMDGIFTIGEHPYSNETNANPGVTIYELSDILAYSSHGNQPSSSTFTVTESIPRVDANGKIQREVKGTYNCRLFKFDGSYIDVTNGSFHLLYNAYYP